MRIAPPFMDDHFLPSGELHVRVQCIMVVSECQVIFVFLFRSPCTIQNFSRLSSQIIILML